MVKRRFQEEERATLPEILGSHGPPKMGEFLATVLGLLKWKILSSNLHGKGKGASYRLREEVTELDGVYGQPLEDGHFKRPSARCPQ